MIRIFGTIFAGLLGLAFGSFLNVCLSRWPEGESVVAPRSHCRICDHTLSWWENIPVVSWLALRGHCRNCHTPIGWRYPLVELAVGALWAVAAWRSYDALFPLASAAGMMFLIWVLVGLAAMDAELLWLPDAVTLPGIAVGFIWWFLEQEQAAWALHLPHSAGQDAQEAGKRLLAIAVAALIILIIRWTYQLIRHREGIGLGDAKLMALVAAWLGLPGALLTFALGAVLGAFAAIVLLAVPAARRDSETWAAAKLPLGTFLCIGGAVSALWDQQIIAAYLRWSGF
ncbi:MAG TPA: prepilin peptidase [Terracidiphilus sp.]|jgi:leader peptidase (prepilin peptidase)/N-methyltransferase